jgi:alpha-mannosidase
MMYGKKEDRLMYKIKMVLWLSFALLCNTFSWAEPATNKPVMYLVGYAHLDTQWRWTYVTTIKEYLPNTLNENFEMFEKYPEFVFNFSGANRYRMIKEYYPADYLRMKDYITKGRWFPCGSSWEESDVNVPSSESLIRQILFGHQYFKKEFGVESAEFMLPDCFGFPASLPSILAHCGIKGFSTQKLSWGSAVGIPFDIGLWQGPDGKSVIAALNPGAYVKKVKTDLSNDKDWLKRCQDLGDKTGFYAAYRYYGVGDEGGSPTEESIKWVKTSMTSGGPLKVLPCKADQMFRDITEQQQKKLPRYEGDLLLTEHSAGSISSQAYMKRWNRMNEVLADAAEKASVSANLIGASPYPREMLNNAWGLVLGGQFHDILPGTSIPDAYKLSQNDEVIALNSFATVLTEGLSGICRSLDTQVGGIPLVVFNPLSVDREDPVEAFLSVPSSVGVQIHDAAGHPVPTQVLSRRGGKTRVLFLARVPSVGVAVFSAVTGAVAVAESPDLKTENMGIENARYRVTLNKAGDIDSVYDKAAGTELLSSPARLAFTYEKPAHYPAWNMDWKDRQKPPVGYVDGPAKIRVVENGPVRVAIEVKRRARDSIFTQTIRLSTGSAGDRVEVACIVDWQGKEQALKAEFPLTVSNPMATYNWELGKIERGNNEPKKYEVPTHRWMDLTNPLKTYGVTILTDTKYGTDKPADNILRLTLLYTPAASKKYADQSSQDWGRHEFVYGLAGHTGDWRSVPTDWTAGRMSQPMPVFQAEKHAGTAGRSFSLIQTTSDRVAVQAVKLAEDSDDVIVRLQELRGEAVRGMEVSAAAAILSANEVNGVETVLGSVPVTQGKLTLDFTPYQIRSLALKLKPSAVRLAASPCMSVSLPYDTDVFSRNGDLALLRSGFYAESQFIPAEMIGDTVTAGGVTFSIGPRDTNQLNAVACRGQKIDLPPGKWNRVYILAAAAGDDTDGQFTIGNQTVPLRIQSWGGFIGQWDTRVFQGSSVVSMQPGFIKRDPVAWFCSHRHFQDGHDDPYAYSYLFEYAIDIPAGSTVLTLPQNESIRVVAASVSCNGADVVTPVYPLYDDFAGWLPSLELR